MISFLVQSGISMAVLLALYHLLLQRENMHLFNRFFLLFAICFSLIIPFIQIEVAATDIPLASLDHMFEMVEQQPLLSEAPDHPAPGINLFPLIFSCLYLAGAAIMLTRFVINLARLRASVVKHTTIPFGIARLVLLDQPVAPYSFLNYIFISKKDFDNKNIEEELYQHESTHVRQKHSWDILFIELLLIVFWFNPLLYFFRRAIKLNHEFLADGSVLRINNNVPSYQQILLQKIFMNKASGLASHVHYSLTKKRLIMMTKSTSLLKGFLLKTLALAFCAGLMLTFCIESVAQVPPPPPPQKEAAIQKDIDELKKTTKSKPPIIVNEVVRYTIVNQDSLRQVKDRYYGSRGDQVIYSWSKKGEKSVAKKYSEMTQAEKDALPPPPPVPKLRVPSQEQLDAWLDDKNYGVWVNNKRVTNDELRNYKPADFGEYYVSKLAKNAVNYGKHYYQVDITTRDSFDAYKAMYRKLLGLDDKQ